MKYIFWLLLIFLITFRYFTTKPTYNNGDKIRITSRILSEPIYYENSQYIKLEELKIYLDRYPEVSYGDKIIVEGLVDNDKLINPRVTSHQQFGGVFGVRKKLLSFYKRSLPEPHSSLIAGVTIGSKNMPRNFWDKLKITGTAHVVVASGMNVTLVAGFLLNTFVIVLPRKKAIPLALAGIWTYVALSGFDAPLVRAAIMGSIAFSAQELGRLNLAWRALFLSAAIMLIVKPTYIHDLGFILSFVATASLMLFQNKVDSLIQFIPSIFREGLSTSLAAQIGVAPILYLTFGQFNLLSPIINALILWVIGPLTTVSLVAGIAGLLVPQLGRLILLLVYPLTSWFIIIVNATSH